MRYYESTDFLLRVIVFDFTDHQEFNHLTFRLIPMFHIGTSKYYDNILSEINSCDRVLYEGFAIKKTRIFNDIGKYSKVARSLRLESQFEYLTKDKMTTKLIHADLNPSKSTSEWRKLRLTEQLRYRIVNPIRFRYETRNLTRYKLAKAFMSKAEEMELAYGPIRDEEGTVENLMWTARDNVLLTALDRIFKEKNGSSQTIGILYGAGHMKKTGRYLIDEKGFKVADARFIKVFDI